MAASASARMQVRARVRVRGWLDLEPGRLQEAVRRAHGHALDDLLA
jgi:hypothetical protein